MKDLPLEVLRDLWRVRFGPSVLWDEASAAVAAGEHHWNDAYRRLRDAGMVNVPVAAPMRIVVVEEDACSGPAAST